MEPMIKYNVKDSLFTHMFKDKKYLLQLYQALHPEDTQTGVDDLSIMSIENVFTNDIYNDLGFLVNDKLVVLVEAQSTWSPNIILRMFLYLAKSYQTYIYGNPMLKAKLYGEAKIEIPETELYVIYAGKKENKPSVLSLRDELFQEESPVDLRAKVIYADEDRDDIIGEYLAFCTILKEQLLLYNGDKQMAIEATIRICIQQGKLVKYLSEHRREVEEYMLALMTSEEAYESYGDYREIIGTEKGLKQGQEQTLLSSIRNVMQNFNVTAEQAMKSLEIPKEDYDKYLHML
ncbi:MAG: hypothetical protein IJR96_07780 [Pseudobutyrivibrio sp.]|nr:hypothetical protein [Pseudobutyrivibrio sp.]